ncbi:YppG family protein [Peribacillus tepidiphilus]|uniref:YppG family protein n=1 Tax=Peribacillus tepidiphilus TaxID=2652445 RepID=UPI001CDCB2FE|nr:YppG family protein [Peribacillus tepidiphilus]
MNSYHPFFQPEMRNWSPQESVVGHINPAQVMMGNPYMNHYSMPQNLQGQMMTTGNENGGFQGMEAYQNAIQPYSSNPYSQIPVPNPMPMNAAQMPQIPFQVPHKPNPYQGLPQNLPFPLPVSPFQPVQQQKSWFDNPLQPPENVNYSGISFPNPYPKQSFMQKPQASGFQSVMNQFKTQDGSIDINKMMNTAGQMMGTLNQVSGMVKSLGSIFKT